MDRIRAGGLRRRDDRLDIEIALEGRCRADMHGDIRFAHMQRVRVGIGIDGDGADIAAFRIAQDPHGDLAAISHENGFDGSGHGAALRRQNTPPLVIPETPKALSGTQNFMKEALGSGSTR